MLLLAPSTLLQSFCNITTSLTLDLLFTPVGSACARVIASLTLFATFWTLEEADDTTGAEYEQHKESARGGIKDESVPGVTESEADAISGSGALFDSERLADGGADKRSDEAEAEERWAEAGTSRLLRCSRSKWESSFPCESVLKLQWGHRNDSSLWFLILCLLSKYFWLVT